MDICAHRTQKTHKAGRAQKAQWTEMDDTVETKLPKRNAQWTHKAYWTQKAQWTNHRTQNAQWTHKVKWYFVQMWGAKGMRVTARHLGGSGGMLAQKIFEFWTLWKCFWCIFGPFLVFYWHDWVDWVSSCFSSSGDILLALTIFDPKKVPSVDSEDLSSYGETSIKTLLEQYGVEKKTAETLQGETKVKEPVISSDIITEWKPSINSWLSSQKTTWNYNWKSWLQTKHI